MNEDSITVAVTRVVDGEQKTEAYSLTFEEYALVKPVFDAAEKAVATTPQLPHWPMAYAYTPIEKLNKIRKSIRRRLYADN